MSSSHFPRCSLILLRHGISEDERSKRFAGWHDSPLTPLGYQQMHDAARILRECNVSVDVCFSSLLRHATTSLFIVQEGTDLLWLPVYHTWRLNDRMLGHLTGFQHDRASSLYGQQQVHQWLSYSHLAPPPLSLTDWRHPRLLRAYTHVPVPCTESLLDLRTRLKPFLYDELFAHLHRAHNVLVVVHEDVIKALVRLLLDWDADEHDDLPVPVGIPLVFDFCLESGDFVRGRYLSCTSPFDDVTHPPHRWFPIDFDRLSPRTNAFS